jgi:hypothetical protein
MRIDEISWSLGSFSWFFQFFFWFLNPITCSSLDVALFQVLFRQINEVSGVPGLAPSRSLLIQKWGYGPNSFHELFVGSFIYIYTYLVHGISVVLNHGIYIYIWIIHNCSIGWFLRTTEWSEWSEWNGVAHLVFDAPIHQPAKKTVCFHKDI